jgi:hypothetical protein
VVAKPDSGRRLQLPFSPEDGTEGKAMTPDATPMLIDNAGQLDASETVRFGVDGHSYEIDLSARRASELRSMAGRYVRVARKIPSAPARERRQPSTARAAQDEPAATASTAAIEADVRGGEHALTDREKQELRTIADAAKPGRNIVAGRLVTKGLADRDTAGNWWLTDAGRRELTSA